MIIESGFITEGLFGEVLMSMLEVLPYVEAAGWKPEWIIRTENYGEPPTFNIFPSIIQTTYTPSMEPPGVISLEELTSNPRHISTFNGDFHLANKYWKAYFRFADDVQKQLESFCEKNLLGDDTLGVHYRGTDKNVDPLVTNPVSASEFLSILVDFLTTHSEIKTAFVASDDFHFIELIKEFARGRIRILTHEQPRSKNGLAIFRGHDVSENQKVAKRAILDCLTLSRCRYCLCCQSALSAFAKILNPNLRAQRVAACKPDWFPIAHIPRYRGSGQAARKLLQVLQRDDWEERVVPVKKLWRAVVPVPARRWLSDQRHNIKRSVRKFRGNVDHVSLRRTTPVCADWGKSRGQVIDRLYIEQFLAEHAADVQGHVLVFSDDVYARQYGGSRVTRVDVLHLTRDNSHATIPAGFAGGERISPDTLDCIICTQVLPLVYDLHAAIRTFYRILKPGGVVLVTAPGVAHKISRVDMDAAGDYWRFTSLSLRRLFAEVFPKDRIEVKAYGNVLAAIAFLHGFAVEDLKRQDLEYHDPDFEVSIALRAVKPNQALTT